MKQKRLKMMINRKKILIMMKIFKIQYKIVKLEKLKPKQRQNKYSKT